MDFSSALVMLKAGQRICRLGWNGKGMWLIGVHIAERWVYPDVTLNVADWIAMKTVDDHMVPWCPSQTDILAEDWMVIG